MKPQVVVITRRSATARVWTLGPFCISIPYYMEYGLHDVLLS
jgi:hypothetical protein